MASGEGLAAYLAAESLFLEQQRPGRPGADVPELLQRVAEHITKLGDVVVHDMTFRFDVGLGRHRRRANRSYAHSLRRVITHPWMTSSMDRHVGNKRDHDPALEAVYDPLTPTVDSSGAAYKIPTVDGEIVVDVTDTAETPLAKLVSPAGQCRTSDLSRPPGVRYERFAWRTGVQESSIQWDEFAVGARHDTRIGARHMRGRHDGLERAEANCQPPSSRRE
jgi:hypothetical protein